MNLEPKDIFHVFIGRKKPEAFDELLNDPNQAVQLIGWPRGGIRLHFSKEFYQMKNRDDIKEAVMKYVFGATQYTWIITSDEP